MDIRYTTAPEVFDGFGTVTLEILPLKNKYGREPYRKVEIPEAAMFNDWQINRYASGMYPSLDESMFQEWLEFGLIVETQPI